MDECTGTKLGLCYKIPAQSEGVRTFNATNSSYFSPAWRFGKNNGTTESLFVQVGLSESNKGSNWRPW